jgi:hypothetical protein
MPLTWASIRGEVAEEPAPEPEPEPEPDNEDEDGA